MKKVVGMRNIIIVVLCLTIICLGIGFIILSMELSGIKSGKNTYDLAFVEVNNISTVSGWRTNNRFTGERIPLPFLFKLLFGDGA